MTFPPRSARPDSRRSAWALVTAVAVLLLTGMVPGLGARPAWAHNTLIGSDPQASSTIDRAPSKVTLTFNDDAITVGTLVEVRGDDGVVSEGPAQVSGSTVTQPLRSGLGAGNYLVTWRVTSKDGHPVSDTFRFTVLPGAAASTGSAATPGQATAGQATAGQSSTASQATAAQPGPITPATSSPAPSPAAPDQPATTPAPADPGQHDATDGIPSWVIVSVALAGAVLLAASGVLLRRR